MGMMLHRHSVKEVVNAKVIDEPKPKNESKDKKSEKTIKNSK